jgi:hypothetical protein
MIRTANFMLEFACFIMAIIQFICSMHKCQKEDSVKNTSRSYYLIAIHCVHMRGAYGNKKSEIWLQVLFSLR